MIKRSRRSRRGLSLIWVGLLLLILIGLIGLACDVGHGLLVGHQLQNAADSAALAGAAKIKNGVDEVRLAAMAAGAANDAAKAPVQLQANDGNAADGDIVIGRFDRETRTFTPTLEAPNAVKVMARRTEASLNGALPTLFGQVFGVDAVDVEREAIAMNQGGTGGGMIALCPDCECALEVTGTSSVIVNGGDVQVNSENDCAACGNGTTFVDAPNMYVAGGVCSTPGTDWPTNVSEGAPPIPDPLAFLPEPVWDENADLGAISGSGTYGPGYYSEGIHLTGGDVTLLPGIYVCDGSGLQIGGNTNFWAEGVMIYVPDPSGYVDIDGSGVIHMTPPDPDDFNFPEVGTYEGVTIFQGRDNTNDSRIIGTGLLDLQGTLYFPKAFLEIGGTGDGFGNQLIAWELWVHGTGDITINYDGSFPAPGNKVFLIR